jgi:predicted DNA-binding transcriptional regulator AlpA
VTETPYAQSITPTRRTLLDGSDDLVNDYEVARIIGVKRETCIRWRELKKGPPFYRVGRAVRYSEREVRAWLRTRRVVPRRA